ncbi:MAG: 4'-phosphopantetheinyl transferase family protein [Acidimicrobiales bacterium]
MTNVVDVWLVPVAPGAAADPSVLALLGDGGADGLSCLGFAADRDRAVCARAAARVELGRRLGLEPAAVALVTPPGRRPLVVGHHIGVSWSHSGAWVALAVADGRAVGVDIEQVPAPPVPPDALAAVGARSLEEFVAREAAGKAAGQGLALGWPEGVSTRPLPAPPGYVAAVAACGDFRVSLSTSRASLSKIVGRHLPPPAGVPSPLAWGTRQRLRGAAR